MSLYHQAALAVPSDGSNLMQLSKEFLEEEKETILQYPQTGRTSCNLLDMPVCRSSQILAVPSDGSNLMQLITCSSATFIIELAVPSDGSNLMQQQHQGCGVWNRVRLAVPSDGSNLMQRLTNHFGDDEHSTCSTLRRVEPHATLQRLGQELA